MTTETKAPLLRARVHLAAEVERELADELKARALENERSVSAEVRIALRAHLKENAP